MKLGFLLVLASIPGVPALATPASEAERSSKLPPSLEAVVLRTLAEEAHIVVSAGEPGVYLARNPARGIDARLSPGRCEITGTDPENAWTLGLRLDGWGRGRSIRPLRSGPGRGEGSRVEFAHEGVSEWFRNEARGVAQGFTIEEAPPKGEDAGPLQLVLSIDGGFTIEVRSGARDARFINEATGAVVHYTGLRAWDASERELEARFEADGRRLRIRVTDEGAVYPLTVDPWVWTEEPKLAAGGAAAGDLFGCAVGLAFTGKEFTADLAIVGAPHAFGRIADTGAAYVFEKQGSSWTFIKKLYASDGRAGDLFGSSVSIDTTNSTSPIAAVGAPGHLHTGGGTGSVYTYRKFLTWGFESIFTASDRNDIDGFGASVAVYDHIPTGTRILVGCPGDDHLGTTSGAGSAYVFTSMSPSLEEAKLFASNMSVGQAFGTSVALRKFNPGNWTALVGAPRPSGGDAGAVYAFTLTSGAWGQDAILTGTGTMPGARFGESICLSGIRTVIGAPGDDGVAPGSGAAYVFAHAASVWTEEDKLVALDGAAGDEFGNSVDIHAFSAVVGAPGDDDVGMDEGSAYGFVLDSDPPVWIQRSKLTASDGSASDCFGCAVALAGDILGNPYTEVVLIGSRHDDDAGPSSGSAYLYTHRAVAGAIFRNAGTNPASHVALTLPILGTTYSARVNAGMTGHLGAWLVGFSDPLTFTLGGGQVVLVDITQPELFGLMYKTGSQVQYDLPVPNDISFLGTRLYTQAAHLGGAVVELSNALDLFLGD